MDSGIWRTQRGRQAGSRGRTFQAGSGSRGRSEASPPEASWAKWSFMGKLEAGTAWRLVHGIRFCPTHTGRRAKFQAEALFSKCWLSSKGHNDTEGPGDAAGRKLIGAPTCVDLPVGWGTAASQPAGVWQSQGAAVTLRRWLQDEESGVDWEHQGGVSQSISAFTGLLWVPRRTRWDGMGVWPLRHKGRDWGWLEPRLPGPGDVWVTWKSLEGVVPTCVHMPSP